MKTIVSVHNQPSQHWVGDGFPVRSVITPSDEGHALGPFILMDYAGPTEFAPSTQPRGVDSHPHKGFETVTIVFQGEVEHRDSVGNSGKIGPGDVQWMTAASGILHEEKHSADFTAKGGSLEMAQIWVNLPARDKAGKPGYQTILSEQIPSVSLGGGKVTVRIVAGAIDDATGVARTHTPVNVWLINVAQGGSATLPIPDGQLGGVYVRRGAIRLGGQSVEAEEFARFSERGDGLEVKSETGAELLALAGEPIDEPMVAYGPFVMNTEAEIREAISEFRSGKYGRL